MFKRLAVNITILGLVMSGASTVHAQSSDVSPTILIESGPSDIPSYRRMIFVKYLSGDRVTANYKAYNRSEFRQVPDSTPAEIIQSCSRGAASQLKDIDAFETSERERAQRGQVPEIVRFCIKGVRGWEAGNKDRYTDPIFNGMPMAATRR